MIEKELKKYMTVYLDMDGVIADFFKAFAEANGKKHWKDVEDIETKINELAKTDFFNTLELYPTSKALVDLVKKFAVMIGESVPHHYAVTTRTLHIGRKSG